MTGNLFIDLHSPFRIMALSSSLAPINGFIFADLFFCRNNKESNEKIEITFSFLDLGLPKQIVHEGHVPKSHDYPQYKIELISLSSILIFTWSIFKVTSIEDFPTKDAKPLKRTSRSISIWGIATSTKSKFSRKEII